MKRRWLTCAAALAGVAWACAAVAASADQTAGQTDKATDQSAHQTSDQAKQQPPETFGYEQIVAKAKALAGKPYEPRDKIPEFLRALSPAAYDDLHFRPEKALWPGERIPYEVHFYHPGSFYAYPVTVRIVTENGVKPLAFSPDYFDYPSQKMRKRIPENLGFAGIKILHQLNSAQYLDEVLSFLGASYFRAVPEDAHYGLSARGLAINTATNGGEEFPAFTHFWLVKPDPGDEKFTLYALLDSPSVAGAYKFVVDPGETTTIDVSATLFTRTAIEKIGIAPLTSMFMWGENGLHHLPRSRPEAHDSDGLLIHNGNGEWLWRPLRNPRTLTINQFVSDRLLGFGLLQRDRNFFHYQSFRFEYQHRPGLWVVPQNKWGPGVVELVQIPSESEINDNIVAYWVPDDPAKAGEVLRYDYTLKWLMHEPTRHDQAITHATRIGYAATEPGQKKKWIKVAIEFMGGRLDELTTPASVVPHVSARREVELTRVAATHNRHTDGWRLSFRVPANALEEPLELRAYLATPKGQVLTETWTYTLTQ